MAALDELRQAGQWTQLAAELDAIQQQAAAAAERSREAERSAVALVERRDELRGLLDAYHARAARLGDTGNTDLEPARHRPRAGLARPCDLAAAADAVTGYQQAVLALSGRRRRS